MNRLRAKRKFDPTQPVYTRRAMTTHGQKFEPRDQIPWQSMGIQLRTMQAWYRLRRISHDPGGDARYERRLVNSKGERTDGPTIEEWVAVGYLPENYPPPGWAVRESAGYTQFSETGEGPWGQQVQGSDPLPAVRDIAHIHTEVPVDEIHEDLLGEEVAVAEGSESSDEVSDNPATVATPTTKPSPRGRRKG